MAGNSQGREGKPATGIIRRLNLPAVVCEPAGNLLRRGPDHCHRRARNCLADLRFVGTAHRSLSGTGFRIKLKTGQDLAKADADYDLLT